MGQILDGAHHERRDLVAAATEVFDYVIVGSGAAGATAARALSETGASLAIVEEGPAVSTEQLTSTVWPALRDLYREMGTQAATGRSRIPVMQGVCLGGSTVLNSAIIWRMPEDVWQPWATDYGLGDAIPYRALVDYWDRIEQDLNVQPTEREVWGENNRLLYDAAHRLGVGGAPTLRAVRGCQGSARCQLGCPHEAKQSMALSYLPYVTARGATLFANAKVERVLLDSDCAGGVSGHFRAGDGGQQPLPFTLRARKAVLIAASAIQTPLLLLRSGVCSPHLGAHFQAHPGTSLIGVFDREVNVWSGATQGYDVDHHRQDLRFKVESISLPPELLLAQLPGVGARWVEVIAGARHVAVWAVLLRAHAKGTVRQRRWGGPAIRFDLDTLDMANLRKGLRFATELFFAAGARAVYPGIHGLPEQLTSPAQVALLESGPDDPASYSFIMSHLFGTARMSVRPQDGVVGPDFAVHGTRNLYVVDSSVFPTNLGVNPQHTIMGVAMHAAQRIAEVRPWAAGSMS